MARSFSLSDFAKADPASPEAERLAKLLTQLEARLQRAFRAYVEAATSEEMIAAVSEKLERGNVQGALELIEPLIGHMGAEIPLLYQQAAIAEAEHLGEQVRIAAPIVGVRFDVGNPAAAELMRRNQLEFVQGFTDQQRATTRMALAWGMEQGQGYEAMARRFRGSIGLAPQQEEWAESYERLLRAGSSLALDRELRDRRFDSSVEAAVEGRAPLTEQQVGRMVGRYRERLLASRAVTIARTEGVKIQSEGQEMAVAQAIQTSAVAPEDIEQTWHTIIDGRERETHAVMNLQTRPYGVPFDSPSGAQLRYPGDSAAPIEEIANCRCGRSFRILLSGLARRAAA